MLVDQDGVDVGLSSFEKQCQRRHHLHHFRQTCHRCIQTQEEGPVVERRWQWEYAGRYVSSHRRRC
jgi:hypothetical protein